MMTAQFNSLFRAVALTATVALALPAFAQSTQTRVNIPLDFEVGKHSMAAGQYTFQRSASNWQILITDPNGVARVFMTYPVGDTKSPDHGKLIFEKLGDTYRLAEIHLTGAPAGVQIPATKAQIELAKRQKPTRLELAMVRR